jgi:hypothetical protein
VEPLEGRTLLAAVPFQIKIDDPKHEFATYPYVAAAVPIAQKLLSVLFVGKAPIVVDIKPNDQIGTANGQAEWYVTVGSSGGRAIEESGAEYKAATGADNNGSAPEILVQINTTSYLHNYAPMWQNATYMSHVLEHEIMHGMGFIGYRTTSGSGYGQLPRGVESVFDSLTSFGAGGNPSVLYFTGPDAEALYGGPVPLTSLGAADKTGENFYHLGNPAGRPGSNLLNDVMNGIAFANVPPSNMDLAVLADLGWTINIAQRNTTTRLTATPKGTVFGQSITLTATVVATGPELGPLGGPVTFLNGAHVLGTASLHTTRGVTSATLTTTALAAGTNAITAAYRGDLLDRRSTSPALNVVVGKDSTSASVSASPARPVFGQTVTLTAKVVVAGPAANLATGTVTFEDGGKVLGTATLTYRIGLGNTAALTTAALAVGTHSITVVYGGDGDNKGSTSAAIKVSVGQDSTTTTIAAPSDPLTVGQPVTLTALVNIAGAGLGTPTGTVTFVDGAIVLGTGTLTTDSGVTTTTLTVSTLAVGNHSIVAEYGGDANDIKSKSTALSLTVAGGA